MKKIRVCHVITRMIRGGAQKMVMTLLERLDRRRYDVTLITGPQVSAEGSYHAELERLGMPVAILPEMVREIHPVHDMTATWKLMKIFRETRPHIVHSHTYKAGVLSNVAGRAIGVRGVVFSPHGHIFEPGASIPGVPSSGLKRTALYWITRFSQFWADSVTAVSEKDKQDQVRLALAPSHKYCVIRNGIEIPDRMSTRHIDKVALRKKWDIEASSPIVGTVGRLTSEKGHRYLIEAMKYIVNDHPRAKLLLVGGGPLMDTLIRITDELGLRKSVRFLGQLENIEELLTLIDVYVQPSLYESQGLSIMEAMGMRRPVVATEVGGVTDLVQEGRTGLLVPPGNPQRIAEAVDRLVSDRDWAIGLAGSAYDRVCSNFSVDRMIQEYDLLYQRLIEERPR